MRKTIEFERFNKTMMKLMQASHSKIKAKLDAEKAAKKRKPKASASRRVSGGKG